MPKLERFLATVAYDGTDHIGWQVQNGRLSIEGELEERLSRILKTPIDIHGSGRTDSGVHSVGQRFHFDAFWPHPCSYLVHAINSCEQNGILVTHLQRVSAGFHCRWHANGKRYRYEICDGYPPPWEARYCLGLGNKTVDVKLMRQAARLPHHDRRRRQRLPLQDGPPARGRAPPRRRRQDAARTPGRLPQGARDHLGSPHGPRPWALHGQGLLRARFLPPSPAVTRPGPVRPCGVTLNVRLRRPRA